MGRTNDCARVFSSAAPAPSIESSTADEISQSANRVKEDFFAAANELDELKAKKGDLEKQKIDLEQKLFSLSTEIDRKTRDVDLFKHRILCQLNIERSLGSIKSKSFSYEEVFSDCDPEIFIQLNLEYFDGKGTNDTDSEQLVRDMLVWFHANGRPFELDMSEWARGMFYFDRSSDDLLKSLRYEHYGGPPRELEKKSRMAEVLAEKLALQIEAVVGTKPEYHIKEGSCGYKIITFQPPALR